MGGGGGPRCERGRVSGEGATREGGLALPTRPRPWPIRPRRPAVGVVWRGGEWRLTAAAGAAQHGGCNRRRPVWHAVGCAGRVGWGRMAHA